ncbi:MAG: hypothetical protein ACRC1T_10005 [Clostridium chrysemydis]|uniref:hypothetical protein n=1 Tax=Clostridium chrysemydis TaxID=2665504 RepID=UPI003F39BDD2
MRFESKGYEYKGLKLGQKVMFGNDECIIIGFDIENKTCKKVALYTGYYSSSMVKFCESKYATVGLCEYKDCTEWRWVNSSNIEIISEIQHIEKLKDDVLSIKTTKLNNEYSAVEITYQNEDVLNRSEFYDKEIGVICTAYPDYSYKTNTLFIKGWKDSKDNQPFIIENQYVEVIEEKVKLINEKYGIPKRWRAERNCAYYYINDCMNIVCSEEIYDSTCDARYMKGNYFKTEEEAKEKLEEIKNILVGDK